MPPPRPAPALAALLTMAAWGGLRLWTGSVREDALITFRHAENLALGHGWGFNPGEWVQGTTSPLFTLILAAAAPIVGAKHLAAVAAVVGVAAGGLTAWCTASLVEGRGGRPEAALGVALGWALAPPVAVHGADGMEVPLVAAFAAASLWAMVQGRPQLAGAALAGAALTRPEGAVWAMLAVAARPRTLAPAWPWLLPVAGWLAFATWAFGTPVPHSVIAKATVHPRDWPLTAGWALLGHLRWFAPSGSAPMPAAPPLGLAIAGAGVALSAMRSEGRETVLLPAAWALAVAVALYVGRAPRFDWYPVPIAWAAAMAGAPVWEGVTRELSARWRAAPALVVAVAAGCALAGLRTPAREAWEDRRNDARRAQVGRWIDEHLPLDAVVAMEAIGWQGTRCHRRVVDLAGLVSPRVVAIARETPSNAARFARILDEEQPDAVVLRDWEVDQNQHLHGGPLFSGPAARRRFLAAFAAEARFDPPFPERSKGAAVVWVRKEP